MNKDQCENFYTEIVNKFQLKQNSYFSDDFHITRNDAARQLIFKQSTELEAKFFVKYDRFIPVGWYGFELIGAPEVWFDVIGELLDAVLQDKAEGDIQILQIKIKFGGIRIYIGGLNDDELDLVEKLTPLLFDERLIY